MDCAQRQVLQGDLKLALGITWEDETTDGQVRLWAENGIAYLDDKLGAEGDYLSPGYARTLLFEYVRYARDAALDVFENNYRDLLLAMQHQRRVSAYALADAPETG